MRISAIQDNRTNISHKSYFKTIYKPGMTQIEANVVHKNNTSFLREDLNIESLLKFLSKKFKDIDSLKLLKEVKELIDKQGYKVNNIDSNIIAQKPKMAPYIEQMRKNIAEVLNIELNQISIKAKTNEHQDSVGNLMSIVSNAIVSVEKK